MKQFIMQNTFDTDLAEAPDNVVDHIQYYQKQFDDWLYNPENEHGLWINPQKKENGVSFANSDFIAFLNKYILANSCQKARIISPYLFPILSL